MCNNCLKVEHNKERKMKRKAMRCHPWTADNQEPMSCYLENKCHGKALGGHSWVPLGVPFSSVGRPLGQEEDRQHTLTPCSWDSRSRGFSSRTAASEVFANVSCPFAVPSVSCEAQTLLTNTYFIGIFFSILLVASDCEHFYVLICYMKLIKALNYRIKENVENSLFHLSLAKIS